jgi:hypothetical protein
MRITTYTAAATLLLARTGATPLWGKAAHELPSEHRVRARFERAVERYADLHRQLAAGIPALAATSDPEQIVDAIDQLATAIRTERAHARIGAIFDMDVALLIRTRLYDALALAHPRRLPGTLDMRTLAGLNVNEPFPWDLPNAMWPWALDMLPRLPAELEYRFVGYDLVLVDRDANLIVDVLPAALPQIYEVS